MYDIADAIADLAGETILFSRLYGPTQEILVLLVLNAYALMPLKNTHADIASNATGLYFGLSLHLHPTTYADLPEPLLLADMIRTEFFCTDSYSILFGYILETHLSCDM